jgi:hypothetical protein
MALLKNWRLFGIGLIAACPGLVCAANPATAGSEIVLAQAPLIVADPALTRPAATKPADRARNVSKKSGPGAITATPIAPAPSAAETVGNLLAPHASDPDVPLPQPGLDANPPAGAPSARTGLYGRGEDGGGVLGVRIPIPASRGTSQLNTRYSPGSSGR